MKAYTAILCTGPLDGERWMTAVFLPTIYFPDRDFPSVFHVYNFAGMRGEQVEYLWEGELDQ